MELTKSSQQVPQKSRPYETTDLIQVLNGRRVSDCHEDDFKTILRQVFLLVGLRTQNFPDGAEKAYLHTYIYENYGHKTLDEIVLAFKLAIKGDLDIDRNDVKVYDQFTPAYFSGIMEAYRAWLKKQNASFQLPPLPQLESPKKLSEAEWQEWFEAMKDYPLENIPLIAYEKLNPKLTKQGKEDYFKAAIQYYKTKLPAISKEKNDFDAWLKSKPKGNMYSMIADLAKKMVVKDVVKKLNKS